MYHVPMCPVCDENEVGSLPGGTEYYCSHVCENIANAEGEKFREQYFEDEADYYASWRDECDDDPNPYAGTYSEE